MMLVISTQCYENYAWNEDGSIGTGPDAYWKAKGGSEYKILGVPTDADSDEILSIVRQSMPIIEQDNDYFQTTIVGYNLEADDYLSSFEKSQLEYEGEIVYKEPVIEYSDLAALHSIDQYEDQARVENLAAEAFL